MIVSGITIADPTINENMASEVNPITRRILERGFGMEAVGPVRSRCQNRGIHGLYELKSEYLPVEYLANINRLWL